MLWYAYSNQVFDASKSILKWWKRHLLSALSFSPASMSVCACGWVLSRWHFAGGFAAVLVFRCFCLFYSTRPRRYCINSEKYSSHKKKFDLVESTKWHYLQALTLAKLNKWWTTEWIMCQLECFSCKHVLNCIVLYWLLRRFVHITAISNLNEKDSRKWLTIVLNGFKSIFALTLCDLYPFL